MRALGSSLGAWRSLEAQEGTQEAHGLAYPLAVLQALGRPHGLEIVAEEYADEPARAFDAVFVTVLDSRCMMATAERFRAWGLPLRRRDRGGADPLVWAGGQGLHNPMPYSEIADLIVVGDAEAPLPVLLDLWERHVDRVGFLAAASTVRGVYAPAHHRPGEATVAQSVARDICVPVREPVVVSHDGSRRIEIARGCPHHCAFCGLSWRRPYLEQSTEAVLTALAEGPRRVHLQAGDAESHSGIERMRAELLARGIQDLGWTGRADTTRGAVAATKRYAWGVEGVSYRLRRGVGKHRLTDDYLVAATVEHLRSMPGGTTGRAAWHMIAGLPTQRPGDVRDLMRVLAGIQRRYRGPHRNLALHWQPFQPLPGTPLQWAGCGGGARRLAATAGESGDWVRVRHHAGRTDEVARLCTMLARADGRAVDVLAALGERRVTAEDAGALAGVGWGPLDPDAPLPWDWIEHYYPRSILRRAYDVAMRRLAG